MCGILGAINIKKPFSQREKELLSQSLEKISYRGPDAFSEKLFNSRDKNKAEGADIYFGHRRLSIIDLSADGTQPFTNDDEIHIIFNGEIYNYIELRAELKQKGHTFKTKTDTEVIVNLYKEEGIEGFKKMNGMWAFAIYDSRKQQVILSRDRFSIKPLHFFEKDGFFVFASEIKQILPFLEEVRPNLNVLGNYLHNYIIDYSDETFFEGINRLPAKHSMIISLKEEKKELVQYWDYEITEQNNRNKSDLEDEFRHLFEDSVKVRLRSDVNVGNTLSGGLDSSSIAVVADKMSSSKLTNLSVVSDDKDISEEKFVDILREKNGLQVKKIRNDSNNPWPKVEEVIWHNDEPILSLSTVSHFKMMEDFKENTDITVIMSGQGGDETLAGYNKYYFYNLLQAKKDKEYLRLLKEGMHLLPKFLGEFQMKYAKRYLGSQNSAKGIIDNLIKVNFKNEFSQIKFENFVQRQKLDIDRFSVPALTHYEDRSSMHSSLEIRLPFLDYRLVNFNLSLPTSLKINQGYSKYMLRKSIKELPPEIAWRKDKKGFDTNEMGFFNKETISYIEDLFKDSKLAEYGILDGEQFLQEFHKFLKGETKYWVRNVNRIIFAEIWAKTYLN